MLCLLSLLAPSLWRGMLSPARQAARAQAASLGKTPKQTLPRARESGKTFDPDASDALGELVAYETPPQVVPSGPLVAEQIDLDPSLAETPARPRSTRMEEMLLPGPILEPATPAEPATNVGPGLTNEPTRRTASARQEPATPPPGILPVDPTRPNPADILSTGAWPRAIALIEQLRSLAEQQPASAAWAEEAIAELELLAQVP